MEIINHETSPTRRNKDVFGLNPLGKVPILVTGDSVALFDSDVICEYLDGLHSGAKLIPDDETLRFPALRLQAVASGVCDAGIALRWEVQRRPAEVRWPTMAEGQTQKLLAAYDFAEQQVDLRGRIDIGHIALATALSWVEFGNYRHSAKTGRDCVTGMMSSRTVNR